MTRSSFLKNVAVTYKTRGQRYYDLLDFLFHLNPEFLPGESWNKLKREAADRNLHLLFCDSPATSIIHKEGYPFLTLAEIFEFMGELSLDEAKRIRLFTKHTFSGSTTEYRGR